MTLSSEIFDYLDTLSPAALALDWDNSGLQVGSRNAPVRKILVALDPFEDVCREAAAMGAELVITHHPLFFNPIKSLTDESAVGRAAAILIQNGIGLFSCHTNLDICPRGRQRLSGPSAGPGESHGLWQRAAAAQGADSGTALGAVPGSGKIQAGLPGLRYVSAGKPCRSIAVGGGACADFLAEVAAAGCDTFVTSDIKYNGFWDAQDLGLNLIDAGHFYTENPVCAYLAEKIRGQFPDLAVQISKNHADCMKFF